MVSFLKDGDSVAFSQPYSSIVQYGRSPTTKNEVFWVFMAPSKLITEEPIHYVFRLTANSREVNAVPSDTTIEDFWLEEIDRAILESERRRFVLATNKTLPLTIPLVGASKVLCCCLLSICILLCRLTKY